MDTATTVQLSSDLQNGELSDKSNIELLEDMENVFLPEEISKGDFHHPSAGFTSNFTGSPPSGGVLMQSQGVPSNDEATKPTDKELLVQIREQLEYYFSKDNINSDKYLLSQMDGDHYVPISVLASFNQVKRLTSDTDTLINAIKESSVLQIDATLSKVRAIPEKRCILILREISKDTPKEEIEKLFSGENCPKTISCEFAENDCWYITFSGEEDAQEAHRYLREEVREFHGNPIRARIKNVASQRTSTVPKSRPPYPYSMPMQHPMPFYPPQSPNAPFGLSFFDPRYPPNQYPNGFPPQPGFTGGPSGGGIGTRNYSVGSADRVERREGVNNREGGVRRGSTGGSGKRYDDNKSGSSVGGGGGYSGGRFNRREDDRIKNLPNRLRNKRNEEMGHTLPAPTTTSNTSEVVKEVGGASGGSDYNKKDNNRRQHPSQKTINRPQPKLDFAPGNFPPLPTTTDTVAPPPPPPPPTVSEEGNPKLADIVKGKKQEKGNGSIPSAEIKLTATPIVSTVSATPSIETKPTQSNTLSTTVTVTTSTTTSTTGVSVSTGKITKYADSSKSNSNVKDSNNKSGAYRSEKHSNSGYPRSSTAVKPNSSSNNRSRHKEYSNNNNNNKRQSSSYSYTRPQKQTSPVAGKKPSPVSSSSAVVPDSNTSKDEETTPTTQSTNELASGSKAPDKMSLPEKMSYAQMAQQKPKPSPQKQSSSSIKTTGPSSQSAAGEPPSSPIPPESSPPPQSITTITSESTPSP